MAVMSRVISEALALRILVGSLPVFFFQAEDGIRDTSVTGVQTCALPISRSRVGGMSVADAVGYACVTQAILMVAPQWGPVGVAANVRSGQIAVDLLRPVDLVQIGRASCREGGWLAGGGAAV